MRTTPLAVLGSLLVASAATAQAAPVSVATLTLGHSCAPAPATATDSIYSVADLIADQHDKQQQSGRREDLTYPLGPFKPSTPPPSGRPVIEPQTTLLFVLDTTGAIELCSAEVERDNNREWTMEVLGRLARSKFLPANRDGQPVRMRYRVRFVPGGW